MECCQCQGIETRFTQRKAEKDLKAYRRKGPARSTRILLDALWAEEIDGATLLNIGAGIGAIQLELLRAGIQGATDVDARSGFLAVAEAESADRGYCGGLAYHPRH